MLHRLEEESVLKIRIKFAKQGNMKFIGHLDIMRYFQKAIRRADIDVCYSEGFSPHQKMSFASPLGLGLTSSGEYFDIEVNTTKSSAEAVKALNDTMVDGIEVLSYRLLPDKAGNCMSLIAAADYEVGFKGEYHIDGDLIEKFKSLNEINVVKKTKKSEKEIDIKPLIYDLRAEDDKISMKVASGSVNNLKPELVMKAFEDTMNVQLPSLIIKRMEMYAMNENGELVSLESLGDVIE